MMMLRAYSQATTLEIHNQYIGVNQNSLKHYAKPPTETHHNRMDSTLPHTSSPLRILIPPFEFTWPT
ncbi:uncharacterized protein LACBIDRAFT_297412 [Laccaria bicolor S238N-H82]|uniref:Predicted protein n=1 Tax=Laccaria bicolor (strain S238N-H82 / ATCC MYA-4686) TaxID=486041 RepID=B0E1C1_LACBS|nr:uncharacterized protein LACBIDRAFT_316639 [Laccaria bicolor S238N-H82]XP_001890649.1 uncharacterized protein LACBIDRAFT_297412 [Laccaria bicolor S238N-H82]EDQ98703.1 predicted protein [Laccaria bicolor S238N-H82]EDQ99355.1 predicted protein [Laccaria bicolor S238N-H82]|eukprot:XP_001890001.1 predicted protein [Laccaria bicolor S238N-H82]